jgi:uncharacterized repeat protein (TIGR01451 family)
MLQVRSASPSLHRRTRWTTLMLVVLLTIHSLFLHPGRSLATGGFTIISTTPTSNAQSVTSATTIGLTFSDDLNSGTATNGSVVINGSMSGVTTATFSYNSGTRTLTLTPARSFKAGEVVRVSATTALSSAGGTALTPYQLQFIIGLHNNRCVDGFSSIGASLPGLKDGAVAWGDYDNDGDLDLALAGNNYTSFTDNLISRIYRNDGNGVFTDLAAGLTGLQYSAAAWGDYDNDGDLDLVMNGLDSSYVPQTKLYRNNGNSTFTTIAAGFAGLNYGTVAWGDYDGDGDLDLLVAGSNSGWPMTTLYRNNGNGTFSDSGQTLTGLMFSGASWGDYDRDGDLDLAMTGSTPSYSRATLIYENNGNGTLTDNSTPLTGVAQGNPAWGDYDNDGDLDLLIGGSDNSAPQTKLYRNDGSGTFTVVNGTGLPSLNSGTMAWGDYDNDGDPDILFSGESSSSNNAPMTRVYRNNGNGTFSNINALLPGLGLSAAAWGDEDGDGNLDLVLLGQNNSGSYNATIGVYHNDACAPNLGISKTVTPALATRGQPISYVLNYSNSGTMASSNVVITDTVPAEITGVSFQSTRTITPTGTYVWQIGNLPIGASGVITISGTLNASVALGTVFTNTATIKGSPTDIHPSNDSSSASAEAAVLVTPTIPTANATGIAPSATINATFNEGINSGTLGASTMYAYGSLSGLLPGTFGYNAGSSIATFTPTNAYKTGELVSIHMTSGIKAPNGAALTPRQWQFITGQVISNSCPGSFNDVSAGLTGLYNGSVAWGDYDNDGNIDALITGADSSFTAFTKLYHNNGNGTFSVINTTGLDDVYYSTAIWGDYDKDSDLDILLSGLSPNAGGSVSKVYRNNGNATFADINANLAGLAVSSAAWGDYDNDGDLDILLTGGNYGTPSTYVYRNNGNNTFTDINAGITAYNESALAWGDYDNDGDLDILLSGRDNSNNPLTKLYRNNGSATFSEVSGTGLTGVRAGALAWGDYDQDGDSDILLIGSSSGSSNTPIARIYRNNGSGTFSDIGAGLPGVMSGSASWADYDNDGDLDAFMVGMNASNTPIAKLYTNSGGSFSDSGIALPATQSSSAAWGDYNNDGDLDLLLTGQDAGYAINSKIYSNDSCVPDLKIVKSAPSIVRRGQQLTYTLHYSNIGQLPSSGIVITDIVPSELTGVSFQSSRTITPTGTYVWQAGTLAPGASGVITITGIVNPATALGTMLSNTASLTGSPAESTTSNNSSTVTTQVLMQVVSTSPAQHSSGASLASPIKATLSDDANTATLTNSTVVVHSSMTGLITGTFSYNAGTKEMTLTPSRPLQAGEQAQIVATSGVQSTNGSGLLPYQWEYTAGPIIANRCIGRLFDIGAGLTGVQNSTAAWGDYDKDGKLDLVISGVDSSGSNSVTQLYRNTDSGFSLVGGSGLPAVQYGSLAWGDYDNDGDPDLLVSGYSIAASSSISRVYRNNGNGTFTDINANLAGLAVSTAAWGDYDNDGDLDILLTGGNYGTPSTYVYRNNGNNTFTDSNAGLAAGNESAAAWGDYDNDGYLDILIAGNSNASVPFTKLYHNNRNGTFSEVNAGLTGVRAGSAAWGDYDKNGTLDLVLIGNSNGSGNTLIARIYRNNGSGTFSDIGAGLPGLQSGSASWADYDNDGKLDLLIAGQDNANTGQTRLYRNTGSGFSASSLTLPGIRYGAVAWGDQDGDGYVDMLIVGSDNSFAPIAKIYRNEDCAAELSITKTASLSVAGHGQTIDYILNYKNTGTTPATNVTITDPLPAAIVNPSFQSSRPITPTGTYVWQVGALAAGASGTITITGQVGSSVTVGSIFTNTTSISLVLGELNTADNSASAAIRVGFTVASTSPQPNALGVALNAPVILTFSDDLDSNTISSTNVLLYGSLSGVIPTTKSYNAGSRTLTLTPLVAFKQGETIRVRATAALNSSGGGALQPYQWQFTAGQTGDSCVDSISPISSGLPNIAADDVAWGDYDNDGDLDLLMIGGSAGNVYRNDGNASFSDIGIGLPNATASGAAWGDYDNDGDLDFVISGNAAGAFTRIYRNNGDGSFTNMGASGMANRYISTLAWGDYDNDGYLDLAFTGASISTGAKFTKLYHNNGNGSFSDSGIALANVAGGLLSWGDYDNDGDLDLLLNGQDNSSVNITMLYRNNGNNTFSDSGVNLPNISSGAAAWGDYNGDGDLDLLVSGYLGASPASRIYRNNGNGGFSDIDAGLPGVYSSAVAWGDYDNDGDLDILLSGESNTSTPPYAPVTRIYTNNGNGTFNNSSYSLQGQSYTAADWADENGDGFLDLIITGNDSSANPLTRLYHSSPCQPNLGIIKRVTPAQATPGQPIVYTLTYSNGGTFSADDVVITDTIPSEITGVSFQSSRLITSIGSSNYVWQVGDLAPGSGGVITITGQVGPSLTFGDVFTNTATIASDTAEANLVNNSSSVVSRVTFHILSSNPSANAQTVGLTAPISASFNANVNASTITSATFRLHGSISGAISGTLSYNASNRTLLLTPAHSFEPGEVLRVSATSGIQNTLGASLESYQWQFTAGIAQNYCVASLSDTGSVLPKVAFGTAAWGDYDRDGIPDLLLAGTLQSGTAVTRIYHNNGDGTFSNIGAGLIGVASGAAAWGDYDNDGDLDSLIVGASQAGQIAKLYRNNGDGTFSDSGAALQGLYSAAAAWGDYDNDGYLDLVIAGQNSNTSTPLTKLYHNNGNGSFSSVSAGFANVQSPALAWGDYDGDGDLDLLLAGDSSGSSNSPITKLYRNNGNGTFNDGGTALQALSAAAAAWGDYDDDGDLDLVLSGQDASYAPRTKLYRNNGGSLADSSVALANLRGSTAAWGDYDNDGKIDLALSGSDSSNAAVTKLYHNNGNGSFSALDSGLPEASYGALAWGDSDGDGRLELALFGYKTNTEYVGGLYRTNSCTDLGIKKSVTPAQLMPGQPITYTLVYSNTSSETASGVLITDTLPAQLTSLSYTSSGPTLTPIGNTPYAWSAGNLAPGASGIITVTGIVSPDLSADQIIPNTASISTSSVESSYANNSSAATVNAVVPRARFSATSYQIGEGGGSATITVMLNVANPYAAVKVVYSTSNGTALAGSDYTAEQGTLTIPAGQSSATFTIPIINDALNESTETIILSLSEPRGAALGSPASVTLSITDNDVRKTYKLYFPSTPHS